MWIAGRDSRIRRCEKGFSHQPASIRCIVEIVNPGQRDYDEGEAGKLPDRKSIKIVIALVLERQ